MGAADDARDADKLTVFDFAQAQERARGFFTRKARELGGDAAPDDGPLTVAKALDAYFAERATPGAQGDGQPDADCPQGRAQPRLSGRPYRERGRMAQSEAVQRG